MSATQEWRNKLTRTLALCDRINAEIDAQQEYLANLRQNITGLSEELSRGILEMQEAGRAAVDELVEPEDKWKIDSEDFE